MDDEVQYHLPDTSVVDRGPHADDHCLLVLAAQQDGRERHLAWAVGYGINYASDEDVDSAAELQADINRETSIVVVWVNGDRGDPKRVPAATVEVIAMNAAGRPVRIRRQPDRYSDDRNAAADRCSYSSSNSEEDASSSAPSDGRAAEDTKIIDLLSSDDDDDPPFPTHFDEDVAHSMLRKQITHLIDMMFRQQHSSGNEDYVAQLVGRMLRQLRGSGNATSRQKRKSAE